MVINNTQRDPSGSDTSNSNGRGDLGRGGYGNNPQNRQTEAFSNTKNRGSYFGMNEGKMIEPDQTPALSAMEDSFDNEEDENMASGEYFDDNMYEDNEEVESEGSRDDKGNRRAEVALKQEELKATKEDGKRSQFYRRLAQKTWINTQKKLQITKAVNKAKEILNEGGEKISTDELLELAQQPKQSAPFPLEIFLLAIVKDVLDGVTEVGVVTTVLGQVFSFIVGVILFFWTFSKVSGWFGYKKKLIKFMFRILAGTIIVEFIPFIRILPANTIFVLLAHYHETKFVKLVNLAMEVMHEKNALGLLKNIYSEMNEDKKK